MIEFLLNRIKYLESEIQRLRQELSRWKQYSLELDRELQSK